MQLYLLVITLGSTCTAEDRHGDETSSTKDDGGGKERRLSKGRTDVQLRRLWRVEERARGYMGCVEAALAELQILLAVRKHFRRSFWRRSLAEKVADSALHVFDSMPRDNRENMI